MVILSILIDIFFIILFNYVEYINGGKKMDKSPNTGLNPKQEIFNIEQDKFNQNSEGLENMQEGMETYKELEEMIKELKIFDEETKNELERSNYNYQSTQEMILNLDKNNKEIFTDINELLLKFKLLGLIKNRNNLYIKTLDAYISNKINDILNSMKSVKNKADREKIYENIQNTYKKIIDRIFRIYLPKFNETFKIDIKQVLNNKTNKFLVKEKTIEKYFLNDIYKKSDRDLKIAKNLKNFMDIFMDFPKKTPEILENEPKQNNSNTEELKNSASSNPENRDLDDLVKYIEEGSENKKNKKKKNKNKNKNNEILEQQKQELKKQELEEKINKFEKRITNFQNKKLLLNFFEKFKRNKIQNSNSKIVELEKKYENEILNLKKTVESLKNKFQSKDEEKTLLETNNKSYLKEISKLKNKINSLENENLKLKSGLSLKDEEIEKLSKLKDEINNLKDENLKLKQNLEIYEKSNIFHYNNAYNLYNINLNLENENFNLRNEISNLRNENLNLKDEIYDRNDRFRYYSDKSLMDLYTRIFKLEGQVSKYKNELEKYEIKPYANMDINNNFNNLNTENNFSDNFSQSNSNENQNLNNSLFNSKTNFFNSNQNHKNPQQ